MMEQWILFPTVLQRKFLLTLRLSYILSRDLGDCHT